MGRVYFFLCLLFKDVVVGVVFSFDRVGVGGERFLRKESFGVIVFLGGFKVILVL